MMKNNVRANVNLCVLCGNETAFVLLRFATYSMILLTIFDGNLFILLLRNHEFFE